MRFTVLAPLGDHPNVHLYGAEKLVVYVDGRYLTTVIPTERTKSPPVMSETIGFSSQPRRMRSISISAPLMAKCSIDAVGVSGDARFESPKPYRVAKPVVFYGTSITNGFCASHAGVTYEALLARRLNLDYVVVGNIGGAHAGDSMMASIVSDIDAAAYVVDYAHNETSIKNLRLTFPAMVATLRSKHPDAPIICVTPIYWAGVENASVPASMWEDSREEGKREVRAPDGT
jgi:hypothetical protein